MKEIIVAYWLIAALVSVACAATGQILLKLGVRHANLSADLLLHPQPLLATIFTPLIIGGLFFFGIGVLFWIVALNGQELSRVYPLAALGYVVVSILSIYILDEKITAYKICGTMLIALGVCVLQIQPTLKAQSVQAPSPQKLQQS